MKTPRLIATNERGFRLLQRVAVIFVIAVIGMGLGLMVRALRSDDPQQPVAVTKQTKPSPNKEATTIVSQPALRAGFLAFTDKISGFSIATPAGWGAITTGPAPDAKQLTQATTPVLVAGGSDVVGGVRGQLVWERAPTQNLIAHFVTTGGATVRSEPRPDYGYQYVWRTYDGQNAGTGPAVELEPKTNAQGVVYYDLSQHRPNTTTCNTYFYAVATNKGLIWLAFPRQCGSAGAPLLASDESAYDLQRYDILESISLTP